MKGQGVSTMLNVGLVLGLAAGAAAFLKMEVGLDASYRKTADPAYAYLQALLVHTVNGQPFMYYLSECLENCDAEGNVNGVNVKTELEKFGESFSLLDGRRNLIVEVGSSSKSMKAILAIPNKGRLVMYYDL